jgi:hypothetical protein
VWHRSAAAVYGIGHLPADTHEFTLPVDARPAGPPSRIAADLLREHEDPEAVALIVIEAIRKNLDDPAAFVWRLRRTHSDSGSAVTTASRCSPGCST